MIRSMLLTKNVPKSNASNDATCSRTRPKMDSKTDKKSMKKRTLALYGTPGPHYGLPGKTLGAPPLGNVPISIGNVLQNMHNSLKNYKV